MEPSWRQELKKGMRVDVVKVEQPTLVGWTTGTVEDRANDLIRISCDGESDSSDRTMNINSHEVAPYGLYTGGADWRKALVPDSRVDCLDSSGTWYASTVLEVKPVVEGRGNRDVTMLKIGYRTYTQEGTKKDSQGRTYTGWSGQFDEWISAASLRIQRLGSLARLGAFKCNKTEDEDDKKSLQDASDVLLNSLPKKTVHAVPRAEKSKCMTLVELLNTFGRAGGFEAILSRLKDPSRTLTVELAFYYFDIIGQMWYMFHRGFAQRYFPRLQAAIVGYFESVPDVEVRKIQKELFDAVSKDLENVLRRVYTVLERHSIQEHFDLSMNTRLLKSGYLQRRIQGLKGVNDVCKSVKMGVTRSISPEFLADWFTSHSVLEELFGPRRHQQLLQRSGTVLKFLYENRLLQQKDLEAMWEYSKDEQTRQDLFKVVCEVGFPLHSSELEFFATRIEASKPDELSEEALDVIYEPSRYPHKTVEQLLKFAVVMCKVAFRDDIPPLLAEKALTKYAEMISSLDFTPHKKAVLEHCIVGLLKAVLHCWQKRAVELTRDAGTETDKEDRRPIRHRKRASYNMLHKGQRARRADHRILPSRCLLLGIV